MTITAKSVSSRHRPAIHIGWTLAASFLAVAAAVVVPSASASAATGNISFGGLGCSYGINNHSEGEGRCDGNGTSTQWTLHVGCYYNPTVKTLHKTGPGYASIGCWAVPGANDAWITPGWS
jgi:hypothetical protein